MSQVERAAHAEGGQDAPSTAHRERVALVVFVDAEGYDAGDTYNNAEKAVHEALAAADLTVRSPSGKLYAVEVLGVAPVNRALRDGALRFAVAGEV